MLLSAERPNRGSLCLSMTKGHAAALYGLVQAVLPASDWNMCKRTIEIPQELGRTLFAPRRIPGWRYRVTTSRPWRRTRPPRERNERVHPRYRQAKETKCGEMAVGCRSALIVPLKLGNSPWRTQWRKAKRRPTDSAEGNMPNTSRFISMSTSLG